MRLRLYFAERGEADSVMSPCRFLSSYTQSADIPGKRTKYTHSPDDANDKNPTPLDETIILEILVPEEDPRVRCDFVVYALYSNALPAIGHCPWEDNEMMRMMFLLLFLPFLLLVLLRL